MKKLILGLVAIVALAYGAKLAWESARSATAADDAERRVRSALAGMKEGGDEQAAASMFFEGVANIAEETQLTRAWDRWMSWRREAGLSGPIGSFEIGEVDLGGAVPLVPVAIDGRALRILATPDQPLRWAD